LLWVGFAALAVICRPVRQRRGGSELRSAGTFADWALEDESEIKAACL
jgi:hypothetical protein